MVSFRAPDGMYNYLENEARLHDSIVSEVVRSIVKLWYSEQLGEDLKDQE